MFEIGQCVEGRRRAEAGRQRRCPLHAVQAKAAQAVSQVAVPHRIPVAGVEGQAETVELPLGVHLLRRTVVQQHPLLALRGFAQRGQCPAVRRGRGTLQIQAHGLVDGAKA